MPPDPFVQFRRWFDDATTAGIIEPNAMTLATATADGRPSARVVLLKGLDERGLVFYTDFRSRKARELEANSRAALVFLWKEIERQVRIEGHTERVSTAEAESYFRTRPSGSRIGAWASVQSSVIPSREWLDAEYARVAERYPDGEAPLPPHWGGYRIVPEEFEFWQGRPSRLHDRIRYRLQDEVWVIERLSP
jgi:pyridoxamine 5'-phosphate oxidase